MSLDCNEDSLPLRELKREKGQENHQQLCLIEREKSESSVLFRQLYNEYRDWLNFAQSYI